MSIIIGIVLIITVIVAINYRHLAKIHEKDYNNSFDKYKKLDELHDTLKEKLNKTQERFNNLSVATGEFPIQTLDLKAKYHLSDSVGLHNRSIVQLPNNRLQIVLLNTDGMVSGSTAMGVVDTEKEVLDYMNDKGYVKLID